MYVHYITYLSSPHQNAPLLKMLLQRNSPKFCPQESDYAYLKRTDSISYTPEAHCYYHAYPTPQTVHTPQIKPPIFARYKRAL